MPELALQQVITMLQAQADTTDSVVMVELYDQDGLHFATNSVVKGKNYSTPHFHQGSLSEITRIARESDPKLSDHDLVLTTRTSRVVLVFGRKDIRDEVYRLSKKT